MRALAEEAGLGARLLPLRPAAPAWVRSGEIRNGDGVGWRGVARIGRWLTQFDALLDPARPEEAARLDDRSVADFVRLYFCRSALEGWAAPRGWQSFPATATTTS